MCAVWQRSEEVCAAASEKLMALLRRKPDIVNIGLKSFAEVARSFGCRTVQFNWAPPAGGDAEMIRILTFLREYGDHAVDEANAEVLSKIIASQPVIRDVVPAMQVIPALAEGKTLLHAGPPMTYEQMCDPIRGSCVGAAVAAGLPLAQAVRDRGSIAASSSARARFRSNFILRPPFFEKSGEQSLFCRASAPHVRHACRVLPCFAPLFLPAAPPPAPLP